MQAEMVRMSVRRRQAEVLRDLVHEVVSWPEARILYYLGSLNDKMLLLMVRISKTLWQISNKDKQLRSRIFKLLWKKWRRRSRR